MKKYEAVIAQLYQQFPMFQKYGQSAYKPGLTRIREMAHQLEDPQHQFPSIHIAGTNGKGSTAHIIAAALQETGLRVGIYSSPHLIDFRERIKINGKLIPQPQVVDYYEKIQKTLESVQPSFFEVTTLMAFLYFADQKVDVAVIETGLGGRLDATNILQPIASVITTISKEHEAYLGNTLEKIATEKAGIIKKDTPVIVSHQNEALTSVFTTIAQQKNAPIHYSSLKEDRKTDLLADYQQNNIAVAHTTIQTIHHHFPVKEQEFLHAIQKVRSTTNFLGRFMLLQQHPDVIADTGHNTEGLMASWNSFAQRYPTHPKTIIIGCSSDKKISDFFRILPDDTRIVLTTYDQPRAMSTDMLSQQLPDTLENVTLIANARKAVTSTLSTTNQEDAILITGSVFLIGEIFPYFFQK